MNSFFLSILLSSACLSVFYLLYLAIFRKDTNFKLIRYYFLLAVFVSMLLPHGHYPFKIEFSRFNKADEFTYHPENQLISSPSSTEIHSFSNPVNQSIPVKTSGQDSIMEKIYGMNWAGLALILYLITAGVFILRIFYQLLSCIICFLRSHKQKIGNYFLVDNSRYKSTFSFFNWIFVSREMQSERDLNEIIAHEKIHSRQIHSLDILLFEFILALMWFNPLIWMMRNAVHLVHEYIADEGALSTGIDKIKYQALLINQVAEERLITLSSSFSKSLLKKRIVMMTQNKMKPKTGLKMFALIPATFLLVIMIACIKEPKKDSGQKEVAGTMTAVAENDTLQDKKIIAVIAPTKVNVLYIGVENPLSVAVSGYNSDELEVSLNNGRITGSNGEYLVSPARTGEATITVHVDGVKVGESVFRVKAIHDPVARIGEATGGNISKEELLKAGGLNAYIKDFEFDLTFRIISFVMSATVPNSYTVREEISHSDRFSDSQIDLINSLIKNQKLMVEQVIAVGPDGAKRELNSLVFTIN